MIIAMSVGGNTRWRPDAFEKRYRSYDCTRAPKHIRQAALGRHLDSMKGIFPEERAVA